MDWKRGLGLALSAITLALLVYGLCFVKIATVAIKIDLPPPAAPKPPRRIDIFLGPGEGVWVGDTPSSLNTLAHDVEAHAQTSNRDAQRVMLHADKDVSHDQRIVVLNKLREGGWTKVGLANDALKP